MQARFASLISPLRDRIIWLGIAIGLIGFRLAVPIRGDLSIGYQALIDLAWTLTFWLLILNVPSAYRLSMDSHLLVAHSEYSNQFRYVHPKDNSPQITDIWIFINHTGGRSGTR